jgi:hypothetical protein
MEKNKRPNRQRNILCRAIRIAGSDEFDSASKERVPLKQPGSF